MLDTVSDIVVIVMALVVIAIYSYVYFSVRHIRKDVTMLRDEARNFIQLGHGTYAKLSKTVDTISPLTENVKAYLAESPAQHIGQSLIMTLATLGAQDLAAAGFDKEAQGRIKMARRGLKVTVQDAIEDALSSGAVNIGMPQLPEGVDIAQITQMAQSQGMDVTQVLAMAKDNPMGLMQMFQNMPQALPNKNGAAATQAAPAARSLEFG